MAAIEFLQAWFDQGTWAKRLELRAKLGWIITPDNALLIDGASHCVRGIAFGTQGW